MSTCRATTAKGEPCRGSADGPNGLCWAHDPDHAAQRQRNASKAAKSKPSRDLLQTRAQLQQLADNVLAGEVDRAAASVAGQLLNVKLRTIELERRLKETQDLQERIEELEDALSRESSSGRRAWG